MNEFEDGEFDFVMFSFNGLDSINHDDRLKRAAGDTHGT
jgi:hypothetical protein